MKTPEYCIVITTTDSQEKAEKLAGAIVEAKLGACVQIAQINSTYFWEGKLNNESEFKLEIKTKTSLYKGLEVFIHKTHTYQTPEIIQIPIMNGSQSYLDWIGSSVMVSF